MLRVRPHLAFLLAFLAVLPFSAGFERFNPWVRPPRSDCLGFGFRHRPTWRFNSSCFPVCRYVSEYFIPESATNATDCRNEAEEAEMGMGSVQLVEGDFCRNQTLLETFGVDNMFGVCLKMSKFKCRFNIWWNSGTPRNASQPCDVDYAYLEGTVSSKLIVKNVTRQEED